MRNFTVDKQQKLIKFLLGAYGESITYSKLMKLLRQKDIKVNGVRIKNDISLNEGDIVEVYFDGENYQKEIPIVYADENIVVVNKPYSTSYDGANMLISNIYPTATSVHRLDTNTTGLLIFALNSVSENELKKAFKAGKVCKKYLAQVYGTFDKKEDILVDYLVKDSTQSLVKVYKEKVENALTIKTGYKVLETYENSSLIEVTLYTGRTHQIRAHMSFYGHFVIGDGKYGKESINRTFKAKKQLLCAYKINFNFDKESPLYYLNKKEISLNNKPW